MKLSELSDVKAMPPRKYSSPAPNPANHVRELLAGWPELAAIHGLWVTGSHVWPMLYPFSPGGLLCPGDADLDMFACGTSAYDRALALLHSLATTPTQDRPQPTKSRGEGEIGERVHTSRGWVDLWCTPYGTCRDMLLSYPTDGYAHCRAAWSPSLQLLVVLPNEIAP